MKVAYVRLGPLACDVRRDTERHATSGETPDDDIGSHACTLAANGDRPVHERGNPMRSVRSWWRLRHALVHGGYDIVHVLDLETVNLAFAPLWVVLAGLRRAGRSRIVATYHDPPTDRRRFRLLRITPSRVLGGTLDRVYVHTALAERRLIEVGRLPASKVLRLDLAEGGTDDDYRRLGRPRRRVVQVSAFYPPHLGGQEILVQRLSTALDRAGLDVRVLSSRLPHVAARSDAVPVRRLRGVELAHTPVVPGLPVALARRSRNAIVHVHAGQAFVPETVSLVCRLLRRPYIAHVHVLVQPSGRLGSLLAPHQRLVFGPVLRNAAVVVCLTAAMRDAVIGEFGLGPSDVVVMPNGIDDEWFVSADRSPVAGEVLFVGRLTAQKNLGVVIRAMAALPQYRLTVIGDGEERDSLEVLARRNSARNVRFVGRFELNEVRNAMLRSSVLVLPSTHEGMPLVLLEAAAAGLPIIASDIPELREGGLAARLVPADNSKAWASALTEVLGDLASLDSMSRDGVLRAQSLTWEHVVGRWIELYDRLAAEHL